MSKAGYYYVKAYVGIWGPYLDQIGLHADLFTPRTDTMRSFFAQQDHLGCNRLDTLQ